MLMKNARYVDDDNDDDNDDDDNDKSVHFGE
jgi:hypothetical protein